MFALSGGKTTAFEWKNMRFDATDEEHYCVSIDCIVLVAGSDPRDLSVEVLAEAFQVELADTAEYQWSVPVEVEASGIKAGDIFHLVAKITVGEIGAIISTLRSLLQETRELDEIIQATKHEGKDIYENTVLNSSLSGLLHGVVAILELMIQVTVPRKT